MAYNESTNRADRFDPETPSLTSTLISTLDDMQFTNPMLRATVLSVASRLQNEQSMSTEEIDTYIRMNGVDKFLEEHKSEASSFENSLEKPTARIVFRRKSSTTMPAVVVPAAAPETLEEPPISLIPTSNDLLDNMKKMREAIEGALDKGKRPKKGQTYSFISTDRPEKDNGDGNKS